MISDWSVNLINLEAAHFGGLKIKKLADTYEKKGEWIVVSGEEIDELIREGVAVYEHFYAKSILNHFVKKKGFSIEKIVSITNAYIDKEGLSESKISIFDVEKYLADECFFSIGTIGVIRAAIYFYERRME